MKKMKTVNCNSLQHPENVAFYDFLEQANYIKQATMKKIKKFSKNTPSLAIEYVTLNLS